MDWDDVYVYGEVSIFLLTISDKSGVMSPDKMQNTDNPLCAFIYRNVTTNLEGSKVVRIR